MKIFPVVHVLSPEQAVEQTSVAMSAGSDGVFLINHNSSNGHAIIDAFNAVSDVLPDTHVGVNFMTRSALGSYEYVNELLKTKIMHKAPDAIWCDDAVERAMDYAGGIRYLQKISELRNLHPQLKNIKMLGGVAFKYTSNYTEDPQEAAEDASAYAPYVDIVTTSGAGTGKPPSPEKIKAMKNAVGVKELAVASGVDASNIQRYDGLLDIVLIASSIETEPYSGIFDPQKIAEFIHEARKLT